MLKDKIVLTDDLKQFIRRTRNKQGVSLMDLEKKTKHSTSWLSQVEGKRIKTIKRKDLIEIFKIILDKTDEEAELYIENYINENNQDDGQTQFEKLLYSMIVEKYPNEKEININIKDNSITITKIKTVYGL
jgi:transcriptional regulator with XRE-family HTH domain